MSAMAAWQMTSRDNVPRLLVTIAEGYLNGHFASIVQRTDRFPAVLPRGNDRGDYAGCMITALCFVQVASGRINDVATSIAQLSGVSSVYSVTGKIDLVVIVSVANHDAVADVINEGIGTIEGVNSTETHIAFRTYNPSDLDAGFSLGMETF